VRETFHEWKMRLKASFWQVVFRKSPPATAAYEPHMVAAESALVKPRPFRLEDAYVPLNDFSIADGLFLRLRRYLFRQTDLLHASRDGQKVLGRILRESGRTAGDRPYFYLQPLNEQGWLFERSGSGWVISRAHKIVRNDNFLRSNEAWDIVTVYQPKDGQGTPRVSSQRLGAQLVSFAVYEEKLNETLSLTL